ncbi:MAG TPA: hypothetical protein VGE74_08905, partial [Gemmata sp.]
MRVCSLLVLVLGLGLGTGCKKKPAPPEEQKPAETEKGAAPTPPADGPAAWRAKQLGALKGRQDAPRRAAVDEL